MKQILNLIVAVFLFCLCINAIQFKNNSPFVTAKLMGQLGNQMFIIAATVSHALEHGATPIFPELVSSKEYGIDLNYKKLFSSLPTSLPGHLNFIYKEPCFSYESIPYHPNMQISGYFQSEKYFSKHKREILDLFAPPSEIMNYLSLRFADILESPMTVSLHVRIYHEDPIGKVHPTCDRQYFERAMECFPEDALFVVFSNEMEKCKSLLSNINKNIRFIEGEDRFCDLYLMSLCKHNIIANSSFSWWGAYLNRNPDKRVIAPKLWFHPAYESNVNDLLPEEWIRI